MSSVIFAVLAFFTAFLTFDFYGTLLGLVAMILVSSASCTVGRGAPAASIAAGLLSSMASGVAWWSVVAIFLSDVCDDKEEDDDDLWGEENNFTNTTSTGANFYQEVGDENATFFCEYRTWILTFTIISATLWFASAVCVLSQFLHPAPPVLTSTMMIQRRVMHDDMDDGDTVATADDLSVAC
jgi:hypothetical protein